MSRWFKMSETIFLDRRLQRLPASLFRLWANLQAVASWSGGRLPSIEDCAFLLRTSAKALSRRLDLLRVAGLVSIGDGGEIVIVGAVDAEPRAHDDRPAPMSAAERTRRWRERRDGARDVAGDDAVTAVTVLESEREERDEDSTREARGECDESFERFWAVYPARDGDNPRHPAEAAFRKALAAGATAEGLIEAARRYSATVAGREGRFICSAVRWLAESRWRGDEAPKAATPPAAEASGHWIEAGSPEWQAWEAYRGKSLPLDSRGGWRVPSVTPPIGMTEAAA